MKSIKKILTSLALISFGIATFTSSIPAQEKDSLKTKKDKISRIDQLFSNPPEGRCRRWNKNGRLVAEGKADTISYVSSKDINKDGSIDYIKAYDDLNADGIIDQIDIDEDTNFDGYFLNIMVRREARILGEGPTVEIRDNYFNPFNPKEKGLYKRELFLFKEKDTYGAYEIIGAVANRYFKFNEDFIPEGYSVFYKLSDRGKNFVPFEEEYKKYGPEESVLTSAFYYKLALKYAEELRYWFSPDEKTFENSKNLKN